MVTLRQIYSAIDSLDCTGDKDAVLEQIACAIDALEDAAKSLDGLTVKGRDSVDTLLGCMMAIDSITGVKKDG
jgi:hypothetical protein